MLECKNHGKSHTSDQIISEENDAKRSAEKTKEAGNRTILQLLPMSATDEVLYHVVARCIVMTSKSNTHHGHGEEGVGTEGGVAHGLINLAVEALLNHSSDGTDDYTTHSQHRGETKSLKS